MAAVPLDFVSPSIPDLVSLEIWEGDDPDGLFDLIETVTEIGSYPNYISEYTTDDAVDASDWFRIRWVDSKGAATGFSQAVQGNTTNLVKQLVDRIQLRAPSVSEAVAVQVAEFVISSVMHTESPYDPALTPTLQQLEGMTLLGVARSLIHEFAISAGSSSSWTAGLVSMKADSSMGVNDKLIDYLLDQAGLALGLGRAIIAQMAIPPIAGGMSEIVVADISRLLIEVE